MAIIDFRVRPLYKHYLAFDEKSIERFFGAFGYEVTATERNRDVDTLVKELDECGIVKSVVPGRISMGTTNEELLELAELYPEHFIIYPFLDVADTKQALADIDTYIIYGEGQGASIEPSIGNDIKFDDERIYPVYKKLEENHIPVTATFSGWVGASIDNTLPAQIDRVLNDFPELVFIAGHAGWPWLHEMVAVAFKHPNLYLTADFEGTRGAGADALRRGALYMCPNQVVFASSYPMGPVKQGIQSVRDWKLPQEAEQRVFYDNAAKILGVK